MHRRDLLKAAAVAGPADRRPAALGPRPQTDARLLVVFLRGAYDAANVVVPVGSDFYYQSRPTLAHRQARSRPIPTRRCRSTPTGACTRR